MVAARSAAMAFNRLADQRIDAENPRTPARHIAGRACLSRRERGDCSPPLCCGLFVAGTLLFLPNRLPLLLSLPVLAFLLGYSFAKRFTALAAFLAGGGADAGPACRPGSRFAGRCAASDPADLLPAVVLGGAVLLWVAGFDIIYACQDVEFDARRGLRSVPARWGVVPALRLAAACHVG